MHAISLLVLLSCAVSALESSTKIKYSTKGSNISYPVSLNGINLLSASMQDVSFALSDGTITTLELVDAYIARQKVLDHHGALALEA